MVIERTSRNDDRWRLTFAVGKELSDEDMISILEKTNAKSVGLVGKVVGTNRHDYNIYSENNEPLPREGLQYLKEQGCVITMADAPDKALAAELFPSEYVVKTIIRFG